MTENDMLLILHNDKWFNPARRGETKEITLEDGTKKEVAQSYYRSIQNVGQISIRVSNHCTYLRTWINARKDLANALQNLSVVLLDGACTFDTKTKPVEVTENGQSVYLYFVVEQYQYQLSKLSQKDFFKILNVIKKLEEQGVFTDPLKNKPNKRAYRKVLTPDDKDGNPIPSTTNDVHPRQTAVVNNKDNEIDASGNIIESAKNQRNIYLLYESIMRDVAKIVKNAIIKNSR